MIRILTDTLKNIITSWAVILKHESESERLTASSPGDSVATAAGIRIGREDESADATNTIPDMDPTKAAPIEATNNFLDLILPSILIGLLFFGNAVIIYVIFQYRKRKASAVQSQNEQVALSSSNNSSSAPQV